VERDARGDDVWFRFQRGENFFRGLFVLECERGRAVVRDDFRQRGQIARESFPKIDEFESEQRNARDEQRRGAGEQNHQRQLALDRNIFWKQRPHFPSFKSFELILRPARSAASALIWKRTLFSTMMKLMMPPRLTN